jgi:hypothetical protein
LELLSKVEKVTLEQTETTLALKADLGAAQAKMDRQKKARSPCTPPASKPAKHSGLDSTLSLDYSNDGSSAFMSTDGSLLGQNYVDSTYSYGTRQLLSPLSQVPEQQALDARASRSDENDQSEYEISIQESNSYQTAIPTDEELFAIGWAKALDPNSGAHYFFTLDRSRTAWENPLSPTDSIRGSY